MGINLHQKTCIRFKRARSSGGSKAIDLRTHHTNSLQIGHGGYKKGILLGDYEFNQSHYQSNHETAKSNSTLHTLEKDQEQAAGYGF